MIHVFTANDDTNIDEGMVLSSPHIIVESRNDYTDAYDIMATLQQTLPSHCVVGLCARAVGGLDIGRLIVLDYVNGMINY